VLGSSIRARAQGGSLAAQPVSRVASLAAGSIQGVVRDEKGAPLGGAMVSALGATSAFAVTDRGGRFELRTLSPGPYLVRAHLSGFVASRGQIIEVRPSGLTSSTIALHHAAATTADAYPVSAAGLVPAAGEIPDLGTTSPDVASASGDDHGESAWRLRHARRSILKDATDAIMADDTPNPGVFGPSDFLGHPSGSSDRMASNLFTEAPFSGQVNLLTTSSFDNPLQLFTADSFARGIAYVSVGVPVGSSGDWTMRTAVTQGDIASWIVAGSYSTHAPARNRYDVGLSYATQRYNVGSPVAVIGVTDGSRSAGALYGFDTLALSPDVSLTFGGRYARYDYLNDGLISPRVAITIAPEGEHFRISGAASRVALAPGAEEFLPPSQDGIWLPPQRTFSAVEPGRPLTAERTDHLEVIFEHDLAAGSTMSFRAFRQHVTDQLATMFGVVAPGHASGDLHYLVGGVGDVEATGWSMGFRAALAGRVHGSIEYTQTAANWAPGGEAAYVLLLAPSAVRLGSERIHDISTAIETDVPETATRVMLLYRLSNAFAQSDAQFDRPTFDTRFDLQVHQSLPFMNFSSARWEALLAVRNFFRDTALEQSVYDELLVVRPPKRIVGGLTLHF
jgi:hypothetical protein